MDADKTTRDRAVDALKRFLAGPSPVDESAIFSSEKTASPSWASVSLDDDARLTSEELFKLYKGLFYCFWMSDKPVIQHQLSISLADLCLHVQPPRLAQEEVEDGTAAVKTTKAGFRLWRGYWEAMMVEWTGIDKHRVDKYLGLTRRFWAVGLRLLERVRWVPDAVQEWSLIVRQTVLRCAVPASPSDTSAHGFQQS